MRLLQRLCRILPIFLHFFFIYFTIINLFSCNRVPLWYHSGTLMVTNTEEP